MHLIDPATIEHFVTNYGYVAIALVIGLESAGVPLPGETTLIAAAIFAGTTHRLDIFGIVAAATGGAIVGDNIGYLVGREIGLPLLKRYGPRIGLDAAKLRLTQYLFRQYGGGIVFFGRFVAVLRAFAALLAGANRFAWSYFLLFNAAGGLAWASLYGFTAYVFGRSIHKIAGPFGLVMGIVAVIALVLGWRFLKTHEARLQAEADRVIPADGASDTGASPQPAR